QPLRDIHTGAFRPSLVTEPGARSRSANSENGADVRGVFSLVHWWWTLRADHAVERAGALSTEGTELDSLETDPPGVRRASIAGVRHAPGEVSALLLPNRA